MSEFHCLASKAYLNPKMLMTVSFPFLRYTIRTHQWRYTEWIKFARRYWTPDWNTVYGNELYDHCTDPDENVNLAVDSAYITIVDELSEKLQKGWR